MALAVGTIIYSTGSKGRKLNVQLDLGQKYLAELKYEEAVSAFKEALAIEPKNQEAISGFTEANKGLSGELAARSEFEKAILALDEARAILPDSPELIAMESDTYLQWCDFVMGDENYEDAIKLLLEGYEKLGDERLKQRADELQAEREYHSKHDSIKVRARIERTDYEGLKEKNRAFLEESVPSQCHTYYMVLLEPVNFYIYDEESHDVMDEVITLTEASFLIMSNNQGITVEELTGEDIEMYLYPYVTEMKGFERVNDEVYLFYDPNGDPYYSLTQAPEPYYVYLDLDKTGELFGHQ